MNTRGILTFSSQPTHQIQTIRDTLKMFCFLISKNIYASTGKKIKHNVTAKHNDEESSSIKLKTDTATVLRNTSSKQV